MDMPAHSVRLLFALTRCPVSSKTTGAKLSTKARNPNVLLAQGNPRSEYILFVLSGSHAAKMFSPRLNAAIALAAREAYLFTRR